MGCQTKTMPAGRWLFGAKLPEQMSQGERATALVPFCAKRTSTDDAATSYRV